MSRKHFYITFGDEIPEEIEKIYNRIVRKEEYSLEKDALGNLYCSEVRTNFIATISLNTSHNRMRRSPKTKNIKKCLLCLIKHWID